MSTLVVQVQEPSSGWEQPLMKPLDEAAWQAWETKGFAESRLSSALRVKVVSWISMAALVAVAAFWSPPLVYDVALRFVVALGAIVLLFRTFKERQYALAAVFGALALLYNPIAPVFPFSGEWQRALVVLSAVPFLASLFWRRERI